MFDFGLVSAPFDKIEDMEVIPVREIEDVFVAGRHFLIGDHTDLPFGNHFVKAQFKKLTRFKDMEVIPVREIEDVFVAGRKYIRLKNHMTDFHELTEYPVISLEKNTSTTLPASDGFLLPCAETAWYLKLPPTFSWTG